MHKQLSQKRDRIMQLNKLLNDTVSCLPAGTGPAANRLVDYIYELSTLAMQATNTLIIQNMRNPCAAGQYEGTGFTPLLDAMQDYRPFSWVVGQVVQYGPVGVSVPTLRVARQTMAVIND